MTPKAKLRRLLDASGAVIPPAALPHVLSSTAKSPTPPEVRQTITFTADYDVRAINRMASFFDQRSQLRKRYRANGCWHLVVAFTSDAQAQAFRAAVAASAFKSN